MIAALLLALAAGIAGAQSVEETLVNCTPRPIVGTVPYQVGQQAIETNAAAYGAVSFAERTLLEGSVWGFEMHTLANATRVPMVAQCPGDELLHGTAGLDLYSSASGILVPIALGDVSVLKLFYSGSITGSVVHFPSNNFFNSRVFTSYGYAASGIAYTYAAPLAVLNNKENGLQSRSGDFLIGAALDIPNAPEVGTLTLGYVYSQGLYSNISSRKLRLFATTLLTQKFQLLALVKGGLDRVRLPGEGGKASLFGRRQALLPPPGALLDPITSRVDLTTLHYQQQDVLGLMNFRVAYAVQPKPLLHELAFGIAVPNDDGNGELILESGAVDIARLVALEAGTTRMPALPWYGVDGGGAFFIDFSVLDMLHVRRNAPETLTTFPYAQGATEVYIQIRVAPVDFDELLKR